MIFAKMKHEAMQALSANSLNLSHDMRFPTMWYAREAKPQTSMGIRAV